MKSYFRTTFILMATMVLLFTGCSADTESEPVVAEPTATIEVTEEIADATEAEVTDMAGRSVTIPAEINSVYGTNNNSTILLYTLAPEKMIGWNLKFSDVALKYIQEEYSTLPVLGNMYGSGKMANAEEILTHSPDIAIIADTKVNDKVISAADELQTQLGIPVVVICANVNNYDEAYTFMGSLFGAEAKAEELAAYYLQAYEEAKEISAALTEDAVSIYYARMDNGLTTEFAGSPNAELIELIGADNVAVVEGAGSSGEVSIEQVIEWNPEVILIGHKGAAKSAFEDTIKTDEVWATIDAVANDKVYSVPRFPFNWFDRPPSVNRIIGIKWLGNKIYPESYDYDMVEVTKEFFELFYGCEISDEEATKLIG